LVNLREEQKAMFEMTFPDGIRRGMAHDAKDHPRVYVTKGNSIISQRDWKRFKSLASDNPFGPEHDLVRQKDGTDDLPDSVRAPDLPTSDAARRNGHDDSEGDLAAFVEFLRGRGLDESSIREALEIVRGEMEPAEDALPVAGAAHAALPREENDVSVIKKDRQPGGKFMPTAADSARFEKMFPEAERLLPSLYEPPHWREEQARDQQRLAYDAASGSKAERKAERKAEKRLTKMFPGIENVGVGDPWRSRR
jgi:hypothetical protein